MIPAALEGNPMTTMDLEFSRKLQHGFRTFNRWMLLLWRLGLGSFLNMWPEVGGRIMVIKHTGRKSGLTRHTPVNYAVVKDDIYCTAGFGQVSDWYRNICANPKVEVWLPDGWYSGLAEDVSGCQENIGLMRQVLIASGFAARAFGINPKILSDEELARVCADYRLVRIRRTGARTGPGGPGDLAWVWPVATLFLLLTRPRRRLWGRRKR
jgi:deazaflavin-dependent oxidoreductase (nitroreductase family)